MVESSQSSAKSSKKHIPRATESIEIAPGHYLPPVPDTPENDFMVEFLGPDDPDRPTNWPMWKKSYLSVVMTLSTLVVAWGSAVLAAGVEEVAEEFHVGRVVAVLAAISLYVVGFAFGPVVWGPSSELVGRKLPLFLGIFGFTCFTFATATCKDFQTFALCRFFMGTLGSCVLVVAPATISDLFTTKTRGKVMAVVSAVIVAGPMIAPVVGGYIAASFLRWRWTMYITGFMSSAILVLITFTQEESFSPRVLQYKANHLRQQTGVWPLHSAMDKESLDIKGIAQKVLVKPIKMLIVEPILLLLSVYMGLVYGILYLCLEAEPLIFQGVYQWKGGNIFLPYLGMVTGAIIVVVVQVLFFERIFYNGLKARGVPIWPEGRLPAMMVSGFAFPSGIFLLCWSGAYGVHWIAPTIGLALIGFGLIGIFLAGFNYIIDTYLMNAASALAANTFLRSGMGAAFPIFATAMFNNLGIQWAGTLLGCLAAILAPVPILFYIFGEKIRGASKHSMDLSDLNK